MVQRLLACFFSCFPNDLLFQRFALWKVCDWQLVLATTSRKYLPVHLLVLHWVVPRPLCRLLLVFLIQCKIAILALNFFCCTNMKKRTREDEAENFWEESLAPAPKKMKLLEHGSIQKLHANQIVTSLTSVVKELLENSLDAGATTIGMKIALANLLSEIRFKDFGCAAIEVVDNGSGIEDVSQVGMQYFLLPWNSTNAPHVQIIQL